MSRCVYISISLSLSQTHDIWFFSILMSRSGVFLIRALFCCCCCCCRCRLRRCCSWFAYCFSFSQLFLMVVMGVWGWETNSLIFLPLSSNVIEKFRLQLFVVNFEGDDFSFFTFHEMMMDLSSLSFPLYLTHVCFFCNIATIYI